MAQSCTQPDCYPDDTPCNRGELSLSKCPHYQKGKEKAEKETLPLSDEDRRIPWTSNSLGLQNLRLLSARSRLILIGIVGAADAGKTTFLATLYCLLRHGQEIKGYRFAGSYTLLGWENLAGYLTWKAEGKINFPPHTSNNAGRVPGLLHLALRDRWGVLHDVVLTDAPGEWFPAWATNKNATDAEGAAWVYEQADAFLLFADSQRLTGPERGTARLQLRQLGERLREHLGERPLGLIWAKADVEVPVAERNRVTEHLTNTVPAHFREFEVSVKAGLDGQWHRNNLSTLEWILSTIGRQTNPFTSVTVARPDDLFLAKRSLSA